MSKPHMFSKLFDFSYQRTPLQAFGFYLAQIIIFMLVIGVILGFAQAAGLSLGDTFEKQLHVAETISPLVNGVYIFAVTVFMLRAKRLENSLNHFLFGLLALALGVAFSNLIGMIVIAWMSTRPVAQTPAQP